MKTSKWLAWVKYVLAIATGLSLIACEPKVEPDLAAEDALDNEAVVAEAEEDFYYEDVDDLTSKVAESSIDASGKIQDDDRLSGAVVTREGNNDSGTLKIDFGTGVTDQSGTSRRGSIVISYTGRQDRSNSTRELTFVDFYVGEVKIEGTRKITLLQVSDSVTVERIDVEDGRITWPDGSIARRRLHRKRERHHNENILDRLIIYGTEEGNHRNGRGFYIEVLEPLVFNRECVKTLEMPLAIEGKKLIKHGQREITVDYGDGNCDNLVTITNKNGRTWEYSVGNWRI
jgi:hypothetical protein